jgi:cyclophilin family peptidyl-prolyl cis-trans isomerase
MCIDPSKRYTAEMVTSMGTLTIELDPAAAPKTVNNFVSLARYHYYDGVTFHRVIQGFVIQGGDPDGTGRGGPGYRFEDELPKPGRYEIGSLAMANAGPNTNGSQFFIISGPSGAGLPPQYSLFGKVLRGMDVVDRMEKVRTGPGDKPVEPMTIESVTVTESEPL